MTPAAQAVLKRLADAGIRLTAKPPNLIARPSNRLTDELRSLVLAHKPELLHALANPATTPVKPASPPQAPGKAMTPPKTPEPIPEALRDAYRTLQASVLLKIASGTTDLAVEATEDLTPGTVLVAVARRGKFSCVLAINPEKYDGVRLLDLIERHTLH